MKINNKILSRYIDDMLSPEEKANVEAVLATQPEAKAWVEEMRANKVALQSLTLPGRIENPVSPVPHLVPMAPSKLLPTGVFLAGFSLLVLTVYFVFGYQPTPMKMISSNQQTIASQATAQQVEEGSSLKTLPPGTMDLEIPDQVLLRLKPGTTMTWQQIRSPMNLFGRPHIVVNVMDGEILARTQDAFWGSKLEIHTPMANAMVKGTAFGVKVDPKTDSTTLEVLAGSVFFSPYLGDVGVHVNGGEKGTITAGQLRPDTAPLSVQSKKALLETYNIGKAPTATLVLGAGPERIDELLEPALLFLSEAPQSGVQPYLKNLVQKLNLAIWEESLQDEVQKIKLVDLALDTLQDPDIAVPFRLYVAGLYAKVGHTIKAYQHLSAVAQQYPQHPMASLSLAAMLKLSENDKLIVLDKVAFSQRILSHYPDSPEALWIESQQQ